MAKRAAKRSARGAGALLFAALFVVLALLTAGCGEEKGFIDFSRRAAAPAAPAGEQPLVIAFAPVMSPEATRQPYERMVAYIAEKLGRPVTMVQKRGAAELDQLVAAGEADVAFLSTGAYTAYRGQEPIELLAMVETKGTILYRTFYTYHHDKSIWAVANHLADGASIDNQIYEHMLQTNPQLAEKVRIIDELAVAPTGPVVVRQNLAAAEKEQLRRIFYEMADDEAMRPMLQSAVIDRFVPPEGALYEPLKQK